MKKRLSAVCAILCIISSIPPLQAQSSTFEQKLAVLMKRPAFAHSRFGMEFYSLDTGNVIYELNSQQLFVPGSTTKLVTAGTALELLGGDYRFHTRIYRTGPINADGTLSGDLLLVASGDPNLSNRIQPDGTLAFENMDHSYGGTDSHGLAGDPLRVLRDFVQAIAAKGIRRVTGHVLVDATLFEEGKPDPGTGVVISPIMVNDNLVDVIAAPGAAEGDAVVLRTSPQTSYVTFVNQAISGKAGTRPTIDYSEDKANPDGTRRVTVTGTLPIGSAATMMSYRVPEPSRYAAILLAELLKERGIDATVPSPDDRADFKALAANYKSENLVAEHVSPPLREEVRVTLKVSQNLHACILPLVLGAVLAHADKNIDQAGFDLENGFLTKAGLDLTGAAQSDGAGAEAFFTPDFMTHYLTFMSKQKDFPDFHRALPILGKDGTLFKIQLNSPAAGHVFAKTGTYATSDELNRKAMITGKGLAGYVETAKGSHLAFAIYINMVAVPLDDPDAAQTIAGEALGEIATAAYTSF